MHVINENIEIIVIALSAIIIIQAAAVMSLSRRLKKLGRSYHAMMEGTGVENLEQVIIGIKQEQKSHQDSIDSSAAKIDALEQRVPLQKSKVALHRYNAFADAGSDLSFSLAILNDHKDGVVLTSIHSREGMYLYGKPVQKGQSNYTLTPEERKVIEEAN
ncbi:hypothetical protein J40TS1_40770 [Paenibacillus montaniterrae]|uniref:DUF4446 family protein n=1 Tax=Paenibacillus montaniterrae TaxID=429341 RepID=A0A919YRN5_9BACL|nr:DUF4446 family protein [Paenibacillus montaniterrae]GIP18435.1 hypothetical protein J40TS1_40770 [Paenibacillus montaniterrae]